MKTEALKNNDIANKEAFPETKLCRYVNYKLENLKATLSLRRPIKPNLDHCIFIM